MGQGAAWQQARCGFSKQRPHPKRLTPKLLAVLTVASFIKLARGGRRRSRRGGSGGAKAQITHRHRRRVEVVAERRAMGVAEVQVPRRGQGRPPAGHPAVAIRRVGVGAGQLE